MYFYDDYYGYRENATFKNLPDSYLHITNKIPEFTTRQFKVIISVMSAHQSVILSTWGGVLCEHYP